MYPYTIFPSYGDFQWKCLLKSFAVQTTPNVEEKWTKKRHFHCICCWLNSSRWPSYLMWTKCNQKQQTLRRDHNSLEISACALAAAIKSVCFAMHDICPIYLWCSKDARSLNDPIRKCIILLQLLLKIGQPLFMSIYREVAAFWCELRLCQCILFHVYYVNSVYSALPIWSNQIPSFVICHLHRFQPTENRRHCIRLAKLIEF